MVVLGEVCIGAMGVAGGCIAFGQLDEGSSLGGEKTHGCAARCETCGGATIGVTGVRGGSGVPGLLRVIRRSASSVPAFRICSLRLRADSACVPCVTALRITTRLDGRCRDEQHAELRAHAVDQAERMRLRLPR